MGDTSRMRGTCGGIPYHDNEKGMLLRKDGKLFVLAKINNDLFCLDTMNDAAILK